MDSGKTRSKAPAGAKILQFRLPAKAAAVEAAFVHPGLLCFACPHLGACDPPCDPVIEARRRLAEREE